MSEPQISQTESVATTPASRREILAWAFYDFANSGYSTVVLTTIYSAYFVGVVAANIDEQSPGTGNTALDIIDWNRQFFCAFECPCAGCYS